MQAYLRYTALMMKRVSIVALSIMFFAFPSFAGGAEDDPSYPLNVMGRDLAEMWCDACHVIYEGDNNETFDGAPGFPVLAPHVKADPDYYIAFLTKPHAEAMEEVTLTRADIQALVAYISSLAQGDD